MKTMNLIRAAILSGFLVAAPASAGISTSPGTDDAYPIRDEKVYDGAGTRDAYPIRDEKVYDGPGTRDAYPIRNQMVYDGPGTRDAYPIRNQMVYDEGNTVQSTIRRWLGSHSVLFARLIASVR
jgi:hypothetical protein